MVLPKLKLEQYFLIVDTKKTKSKETKTGLLLLCAHSVLTKHSTKSHKERIWGLSESVLLHSEPNKQIGGFLKDRRVAALASGCCHGDNLCPL